MATTIVEDDCSHDDGDDDKDDHGGAPDFEAAARNIQNRASKPVGAASSEKRHFREFFGTSLLVVDKLWWLLVENDLLPEKSRPKHLLWTLYFLKVYPKQSPGCSVVGASSGAVDPKTFKKWVWMFIENIQELVDEVVSIYFIYWFYHIGNDGSGRRRPPLTAVSPLPPLSATAHSHTPPPSAAPPPRSTSTGASKVTWAMTV
jgi:hypothetical protein